MNILFFTWNFPPVVGGIEAVAYHLYRGLSARGHAVQVLTRGPARAEEPAEILRVGGGRLGSFIAHAGWAGWQRCRREMPDFLLCSTVVGAVPAWLLGCIFRRPYGVLVHGSDVVRGGWIYTRAVTFLLRRAAVVFANSENTRQLAAGRGVAQERLRTIYPGVEPLPAAGPPKSPAVAAWIQSGRPIILSVGRLIRRKGVLEFIEQVMPKIVRAYPDVLLVVVGEEASQSLAHHRECLRDRIEQAIVHRGLSQHVVLAGHVEDEDLYALLRAARLLVMPVRPTAGDVEGFGIVFMEAALAGRPVVATRIGGIPDAVEDGETGLLTPPGDDAAVAEAVERLLRDPRLADRLGAAGRARALRQFTWEAIVALYERDLREVTARSGLT